ncbi:hypothetical protein CRUP_017244 [Coryphaenoides rupestris]|nr:hypothetical protein CRUP_017244 [Coryphaenoides rupestris]
MKARGRIAEYHLKQLSHHTLPSLSACSWTSNRVSRTVWTGYDWYQTESQVIVTIMAKNVPKDGVNVNFAESETESQVIVTIMAKNIPKDGVNVNFAESEVEIKMKKMEAIRWEKLEGGGQEPIIKHFNPAAIARHFWPSPDRIGQDRTPDRKDGAP